jgi:hypothetical protein
MLSKTCETEEKNVVFESKTLSIECWALQKLGRAGILYCRGLSFENGELSQGVVEVVRGSYDEQGQGAKIGLLFGRAKDVKGVILWVFDGGGIEATDLKEENFAEQ